MKEYFLDVSGLSCPMPVLKANRALRTMTHGDQLRIIATDPKSIADFEVFCRETGHTLISFSEEDNSFSFLIQHR
ncbi:sulfurtransferase TusA family protein [Acetobacter thailandicus]|uniref:Sulfurtransferase TusA family protein n=1 Tax=Acetobacter thailandicus TaxID=1502842 RepID=A0ABT3QHK4_9PROT|nr:sulfurtransferase TusA family protein [Acetobacter thailandicus]MBS1004646.1 sulfurtransferase TusA family protein [Acetobacter thailandicus]MCX2564765.1 sulfurtransferase TusA family protein [Acetobacter thailandicus]NHN96239.1 sulfurtransferase TusA family protein [Acetobacter thailandicus]